MHGRCESGAEIRDGRVHINLVWVTLLLVAAVWLGRRWERTATQAETDRQRLAIHQIVEKTHQIVAELNDTELDDELRDPARTRPRGS